MIDFYICLQLMSRVFSCLIYMYLLCLLVQCLFFVNVGIQDFGMEIVIPQCIQTACQGWDSGCRKNSTFNRTSNIGTFWFCSFAAIDAGWIACSIEIIQWFFAIQTWAIHDGGRWCLWVCRSRLLWVGWIFWIRRYGRRVCTASTTHTMKNTTTRTRLTVFAWCGVYKDVWIIT